MDVDPHREPARSGPRPLSEPDRLALRQTFTTDARRYAARRPTYPGALFDALAAFGDLQPGARFLEIAPGTGQATVSLARRGWRVTAVEMGPEMARAARATVAEFPDVEVVTSAFEDWPLPAEPVDAVFCATAWHWLDPAARLARVTQALRPGGVVAIVWTHHVAGGTREFFARAQDCYDRHAPPSATGAETTLSPEDDLASSTAELVTSPLLTEVRSQLFAFEASYDTQEYTELLRTYSPTIALPEAQREALLACLSALIDTRFGGRVTKRYAFELVLARRREE